MTKSEKLHGILKQGAIHTFQNNAVCFLPGDRYPKSSAGDSFQGYIQDKLKRFGGGYKRIVRLFSPVLRSPEAKKILETLLASQGSESVILNMGSGPTRLLNRSDVINVDIFAFNEVDLVADVMDLPVEDNRVDLVINTALLEHIDQPGIAVAEMHRILKPGGIAFCYVPFMVPFHAAPQDFHRWTHAGATRLFEPFFENITSGIGAGPTSGLLWVLQEWLALLLCFGNRRLHDMLFLFFMLCLSPIKLIDYYLIHMPDADKICSGFYIVGKKRL